MAEFRGAANQGPIFPRRPTAPPSPELPAARSSGGAAWGCFSGDAEMKRRRRVASYKAYAVEGKLKSTVRRSLRWIKLKCAALVGRW